MQEEIGTHIRLGVLLCCCGALVCVVCGVLIFSLREGSKYTNKYTTAMENASTASIYDLQRGKSITLPQVYKSVAEAGDQIREVHYFESYDSNGHPISSKMIYNFDGTVDDMMGLLSRKNARSYCTLYVEKMNDGKTPELMVYIMLLDKKPTGANP